MKRLVVAAVLAAGLHGAAFWIAGPLVRPVLPLTHNRSVTINLVTVQVPAAKAPAPAPKQIQPPPKSKPKPKPRRHRKPVRQPQVRPRPVPSPPVPPPAPAPTTAEQPPEADQPPAETEATAAADPGPVSRREHAAVQESVPLYDLNPPPVYPRVARRRNYQGTVLLDVRVTAKGTVAEVKVAQSSGYSVLDSCALNSVRRWRFEPARRGDHPIETWVQVPVRFELH